ncbi:MAG: hypothetical protein RIB55_19165 [Nitratireductor sp.]
MLQDEATLDELLNDPIILMMMRSDGVSPGEIRRLADKVHMRAHKAGRWPRPLTGGAGSAVGVGPLRLCA